MQEFDEEKQDRDLEEIRRREEEELVATLAESKYHIPYVNLATQSIDNEALRSIPEREAREMCAAPFKLSGKNILVAVRSPSDDLLARLKEEFARKNLKAVFYMVSSASLEKVWERYQELSMAESSRPGGINISGQVLRDTAAKIRSLKDIKETLQGAMQGNLIHKITRIFEIILSGAIALEASDVHVEPEEDRARLRIRLDGVLHDVAVLEKNIYHLLNSRIKILSGMKLTSRIAQDGRFSISEGEEEISIRSSMVPGAYGESIVLRILDPKTIEMRLEELGIEPKLFSVIEEEIRKPNGLVLVTGPTGSGKTTTLYAFLRRIYSTEVKIITIEDPVEYHLPGITQTQTDSARGYTFLEGLRSGLRQDPDVVMVGEIRDAETARTAVEAALTGHMVFSTLHTNNAAGVIPRLIDLEVNPKILVSALSLSIAQRLVRRLCQKCKAEKKLSEREVKILQEILNNIEKKGKSRRDYGLPEEVPEKVFCPAGCEECSGTGYRGRIGIFEAIKTDEAIEKIIPENPSEREIKRAARGQETLTMREDGVLKILSGTTSFEEVQSVVDLLEE